MSRIVLQAAALTAGLATLYFAMFGSEDDSLMKHAKACMHKHTRQLQPSTPLDVQFCIAMDFFEQSVRDEMALGLYALMASILLPYSYRLTALVSTTDLFSAGGSAAYVLLLGAIGIAVGYGPMACIFTAVALVPVVSARAAKRRAGDSLQNPSVEVVNVATHIALIAVVVPTLVTRPSSPVWQWTAWLLQLLPLAHVPISVVRLFASPSSPSKAAATGKSSVRRSLPFVLAATSTALHCLGLYHVARASQSTSTILHRTYVSQSARTFWLGDFLGVLLAQLFLLPLEGAVLGPSHGSTLTRILAAPFVGVGTAVYRL
ncbi:unnamed protein product [Parajaminaea phylloscopi]